MPTHHENGRPDSDASFAIDVKRSRHYPHRITLLGICTAAQCRASLTDVCRVVGVEMWRVLEGNDRHASKREDRRSKHIEPLTDAKVLGYIRALKGLPNHLEYLREQRGVSDLTIDTYRIGYDEMRSKYTLPVHDADGLLVNIRRYLRDAKPGEKMRNAMGHGTPARLYPSLPPSGPVLVCEGEWDALVLRQHGFPAVTSTHGAATFLPEWVPLFAGRHVAFLYDCDDAGRKCSAEHAAKVATVARSVRVVDLDPARDDKWDVSDWFSEGRSPDDLREQINRTLPLGEQEVEA